MAGKLPIDELNAVTGLSVSDKAYDTVGGWVLDLFGRVPRKAERLDTPELTVVVEKVERTRVVEELGRQVTALREQNRPLPCSKYKASCRRPKALPNMRMKLAACSRRLRRNAQGRLSILSAAPAGRSLCACR